MLENTRDFDGARECPTLDGMPGFHEVCMLVKNEKAKGEFTLVMSRATQDSLEFPLRRQHCSLALGTLAVPVTELPQLYPHRMLSDRGGGL